jgi:hypothetical protein
MPARGGDVLTAAIVRPLMFVLWCLVAWGTLLVFSWAWVLLSEGRAPAVQAVTRLSWPNRATAVLAVVVWVSGAFVWWQRRSDHGA